MAREISAAIVATAVGLVAPLWAQNPATAPATLLAEPLPQSQNVPIVRPTLMQMSVEVQDLYRQAQTGIARVQLPTPRWQQDVVDLHNPIRQWPDLNQAVVSQLNNGARVHLVISAATQPVSEKGLESQSAVAGAAGGASSGGPSWNMVQVGNDTVIHSGGTTDLQIHTGGDRTGNALAPAGQTQVVLKPSDSFAPNNLALLLDDAGHLLVPMYLEKDVLEKTPARVAFGNTPPVPAHFVASDQASNLTILQLDVAAQQMRARPLALSDERPAEGSLVLVMQPNNGTARLVVWTGGQQEWGTVLAPDGTVMGFAHYGEFLSAAACRPVAEQLIDHGVVKRAALGVEIHVVPGDSPLRALPVLGSRPALEITQVIADSAASRAGLKEGDLILGFQVQKKGQATLEPVGDIPAFAVAMSNHDGPTTLLILREGKEQAVAVELRAK